MFAFKWVRSAKGKSARAFKVMASNVGLRMVVSSLSAIVQSVRRNLLVLLLDLVNSNGFTFGGSILALKCI